jgi:site-specific recombinase XerD
MAQNLITLSQAIQGYFIAAHARRLSHHTLKAYDSHLRKFERYLNDDPPFEKITASDVRGFLSSLTTLTSKSVLNHHIALSSLWNWGVGEGLVARNVVRDVAAPKPERREIIPFSKEEIQRILSACERSRGYTRPGKRRCNHRRPTALRDRAIVLLLVDTGVRASELCGLQIRHLDMENHRVLVMGKGRKERYLPIAPRTAQTLWRYLAGRDGDRVTAPLFVTKTGQPLNKDSLRRLVQRAGERAGIRNVHPHRFRHTFSIQFLRNGGNVFALQRMLGHASMEMVNRYLALAQIDLDEAHSQASPVANWLL